MTPAERTNHALSLRLTDLQWKHLAVQAAQQGTTLSEQARRVIDSAIDAQPDVPIEGNAPTDPGIGYRSFLAMVDVSSLETGDAEA